MVWGRWVGDVLVAILVLGAGGGVRAGQGRCELVEAMDKGELMLSCSVTAPDRQAGIRGAEGAGAEAAGPVQGWTDGRAQQPPQRHRRHRPLSTGAGSGSYSR